MYLYEANIVTDLSLMSEDQVELNEVDRLDFEQNYKELTVPISSIVINAPVTFYVYKTYSEFKDLIVDPTSWGNVKYLHDGVKYILYLDVDDGN